MDWTVSSDKKKIEKAWKEFFEKEKSPKKAKGLVDVCGGLMTLADVYKEIHHYMLKSPTRLVVDIQRTKRGYRATLWLTEKDFKDKC